MATKNMMDFYAGLFDLIKKIVKNVLLIMS